MSDALILAPLAPISSGLLMLPSSFIPARSVHSGFSRRGGSRRFHTAAPSSSYTFYRVYSFILSLVAPDSLYGACALSGAQPRLWHNNGPIPTTCATP